MKEVTVFIRSSFPYPEKNIESLLFWLIVIFLRTTQKISKKSIRVTEFTTELASTFSDGICQSTKKPAKIAFLAGFCQ